MHIRARAITAVAAAVMEVLFFFFFFFFFFFSVFFFCRSRIFNCPTSLETRACASDGEGSGAAAQAIATAQQACLLCRHVL